MFEMHDMAQLVLRCNVLEQEVAELRETVQGLRSVLGSWVAVGGVLLGQQAAAREEQGDPNETLAEVVRLHPAGGGSG